MRLDWTKTNNQDLSSSSVCSTLIIETIPSKIRLFTIKENLLDKFSVTKIDSDTHLSSIKDDNFFSEKYNQVIWVIHENTHTIVPNKIYDESLKNSYLNVNFYDRRRKEIYDDNIEEIDSKNIFFSKLTEVKTFLSVNSLKSSIVNFTSIFLKHSFKIVSETNSNDLLFANFSSQNNLDLLAFKEGNLILENSFSFESIKNGCYYLLFTINQIFDSIEDVEVNLSGLIKEEYLYKEISSFIPNLKFSIKNIPIELNEEGVNIFQKNNVLIEHFSS